MILMAPILLLYIKFTSIVLTLHALRTLPLIKKNKQTNRKLKLLKKITQHFLLLHNIRFKSKLSLGGGHSFETHIWPMILGFPA